MNTPPKPFRLLFHALSLAWVLFLALAPNTYAGSATWNLTPTSGDWTTAANWTPATVPNQPSDTATFATSNQTNVSWATTSAVQIDGVTFNPGASSFTITLVPSSSLADYQLIGSGITNNSGIVQNVVLQTAGPGTEGFLDFENGATAGSLMNYTINPNCGIDFHTSSTAGTSTITANGGTISFNDEATAGQSTLILNGTATFGSILFFNNGGSAESANITVGGNAGGHGNICEFVYGSADTATITVNGAIDSAHINGQVVFEPGLNFGTHGSPGSATIIANAGASGGAGGLVFLDDITDVNTARIILVGSTNGGSDSGTLDMELGGVTIGSFEGNGIVKVGGFLTVGANNLSTTFSGLIEGGSDGHIGPFTKIGTGTLTLKGPNTYPAGTNVNGGTLVVANKTGSGTGSANVWVNAGTLAGTGIISGPVNVGGSTTTAILSPGSGKRTGTLTVSNTVTFASSSRFRVSLDSNTGVASQLTAHRVLVTSNATIHLEDLGSTALPAGTVFTIINSTAPPPISGKFNNLPDGATITVGSNTFQANYEGGDGNDLTLTVMP